MQFDWIKYSPTQIENTVRLGQENNDYSSKQIYIYLTLNFSQSAKGFSGYSSNRIVIKRPYSTTSKQRVFTSSSTSI